MGQRGHREAWTMSTLWETPQDLYDELDAEFHFDLDVCATRETKKCQMYISEKEDALTCDWRRMIPTTKLPVCWMNPPYGNDLGKWVKKAYYEAMHGCLVVCLLPSRTDSAWFHEYALQGEIRFIRGRIHFVGGDRPRFASIIVIFGPRVRKKHISVQRGLFNADL